MATPKRPNLDEETLRIMERMVRMPPKPHEEMKIGKAKPSRSGKTRTRNRKSQANKRISST